jgi:hypothetical protein
MTVLCTPSEARGERRRSDQQPKVRVTRWIDPRSQARRETVMAPEGHFLLGVALTPTHVRLLNGPDLIFDGMMTSGMTYVCRPAQNLHAEFRTEADFLHLYVPTEATGEPPAATTGRGAVEEARLATVISRDALIDHLARALQMAGDGVDARYIETLARSGG